MMFARLASPLQEFWTRIRTYTICSKVISHDIVNPTVKKLLINTVIIMQSDSDHIKCYVISPRAAESD